MLTGNIGGVPEHFNLPWYLTLKEGSYKKEGINLRWRDCYGGTGEMCQLLRNGAIDIAIILTEGIVTDIHNGNPSRIVQKYIETPLVWGIHVGDQSPYQNINDLKGKTAAVSRMGSGSHLMAYVNAQNLDWNLNSDLKFKVVNNLETGVNALTKGEADYFLWERFTTKPYVDSGVFRKLGDCPTPWPCFVIAVRNSFIDQHKETLKIILNIINSNSKTFKNIPQIDQVIAERYQQKLDDVRLWLSITEWSQSNLENETLTKVQNNLLKLRIINDLLDDSRLLQNI